MAETHADIDHFVVRVIQFKFIGVLRFQERVPDLIGVLVHIINKWIKVIIPRAIYPPAVADTYFILVVKRMIDETLGKKSR